MNELPIIIPAGDGREVHVFASIYEANTIEQAKMMARHQIVTEPVRLMPDCHAGVGGAGTVGSAIIMQGGLIPAAVGPDIGCGMIAVKFSIKAEELTLRDRQDIHRSIMSRIPMGKGKNSPKSQQTRLALIESEIGELSMENLRTNALTQMGTLGSGNHFVEVSEDQNGDIWAIVHSGSRGVGFQLAARSMQAAKDLNADKVEHPDLSYLPQDSDEYAQYVYDLTWAQRWAKQNREVMMDEVKVALYETVGEGIVFTDTIDCHHNYGESIDLVDGEDQWLIRKGAIAAYEGNRGIVPGSMGTDTYIVIGKGNAAALNTAPHGAGRLLGRGAAKRALDESDFVQEMNDSGRVWNDRSAASLLDEAPKAYKDIATVIADSEDLLWVDFKLNAIINCKG